MKTQCPHCLSTFKVKDEFVGRSVKCAKCAEKFQIEPMVEVESSDSQTYGLADESPEQAAVAQAASQAQAQPQPSPAGPQMTPPPAPAGVPAAAGVQGDFVNPSIRGYLAAGALVFASVAALILAWSYSQQNSFLAEVREAKAEIRQNSRSYAGRAKATVLQNQIEKKAEANDARQAVAGMLFGLGVLASFVLLLVWVYRAYKNLHALRAPQIRFSPAGSVGWWFCPILNLWKPYQIMSDVAMGSEANPGATRSGMTSLVTGWWIAWILVGIFGMVSNGYDKAAMAKLQFDGDTEMMASAGSISIAYLCAWMLVGFLTAGLVVTITARQKQRLQALQGVSATTGQPNPYAAV